MKISSVHGRSYKLTILVLSYSPPTVMSLPVAKEDALFPLSRADPEVWTEQVWGQEGGPVWATHLDHPAGEWQPLKL